MEKFYHYDGKQSLFVLNAFSAGGGNSIVITIEEMVSSLKNYDVTEINKKFYDGKGFIDEQGYYHIARLGATSAEIAKEFNVAIDRVQAGETPFSQLNPGNKLLNTFKINLRYITNNEKQ